MAKILLRVKSWNRAKAEQMTFRDDQLVEEAAMQAALHLLGHSATHKPLGTYTLVTKKGVILWRNATLAEELRGETEVELAEFRKA